MKKLLLFLLLLPQLVYAQRTTVTAQVKDTNGSLYVNCAYTVDFVPNPAQPAPYTYGGNLSFQTSYVGARCDSTANLSIQLPDSLNSISPNDSQWRFSICSASGYTGGPYCFQKSLAVTGATQNITATLQAAAPLLPITGGGGAGTVLLNPTISQSVVQPVGTQLCANNENGIRNVCPSYNWAQTPPGTLSAGANTVSLLPCPLGVSGASVVANFIAHWIYITAAGGDPNPSEPVRITGGTCTNGLAGGGTITFNAAFSHTSGYTLGSATQGIQEAERDAALNVSPAFSGSGIALQAGTTYTVKAPLFLQTWKGTLKGNGAQIYCYFMASCLNLGDTSGPFGMVGGTNTWLGQAVYDLQIGPATPVWNVTPSAPASIPGSSPTATLTIPTCPTNFWAAIPGQILWLAGTSGGLTSSVYGNGEYVLVTGGTCTPGLVSGTIVITQASPNTTNLAAHDAGYTLSSSVHPLIEDNAQTSVLYNISMGQTPNAGRAGHLIWDDNDQNLRIYGMQNNSYAYRCDVDFCASMIFSPGQFATNAGIVQIYGADISGQCAVNGIEWYNGNTVNVYGAIIQGFPQYGIRAGGHGGFGNILSLYNPYWEVGLCNNPLGVGQVSIMNISSKVVNIGPSSPVVGFPLFFSNGGTQQNYYVVYKTASRFSYPIPIGYALVNDPSVNNVTVTFHAPIGGANGTTNFDLLRVQGGSPVEPNGTANYALVTSVTPSTPAGNWLGCDIKGRCKFTDTIAPGALAGYTVNGTENNDFGMGTYFSPGGVYLGTTNATTGLYTSSLQSGFYWGVNTCVSGIQQSGFPSAVLIDNTPIGGGSPCISSSRGVTQAFTTPGQGANALWLHNAGNNNGNAISSTGFLTGRLNFGGAADPTPIDLMQLWDSKVQATEANITGRRAPLSDDIALGIEGYSAGKAYIRSPNGVNFYCGTNIPNSVSNVDSTNWCENIGPNGIQTRTFTFATLPAANNGSTVYCSDCNATCAAGGGTGRMCFRENGAWVH